VCSAVGGGGSRLVLVCKRKRRLDSGLPPTPLRGFGATGRRKGRFAEKKRTTRLSSARAGGVVVVKSMTTRQLMRQSLYIGEEVCQKAKVFPLLDLHFGMHRGARF